MDDQRHRVAEDPAAAFVRRRRAELAEWGARRRERQPARPEPPLPPLAARARNAAGAMGRAAVAVARGEPLRAADEVREARLAVCREGRGLEPGQIKDGHCDRYRASDGRCAVCSCWQAGILGKASLKTEDCPLGRWPALSP